MLSPVWAAAPGAAACVVKHQQLILLVKDRVSSRYSLSGGYIDGDETPEQAALRELFEETGLRGRSTGALGQWQHTALFACQTLEPIVAQTGSGFVSLLRAPDLGGEILDARLIAPSQLPDELRRFPAQLDWLAPKLTRITDSPVDWQPDFSAGGSALHRAELPFIQRLQRWLGPDATWLWVGNLLGSAAFQLALLPLLLPLLGWSRLHRLLFAMLLLTLLVQLTKEGLGWPRPFHLQPELARQSTQGFGMPSGHTASALLFCGMVLGWVPALRPWHTITLALLLAALAGLARIWLGVHFISDVLAGLGLGASMLALRSWLGSLAERRATWWGLILVSLLAGWLTQSAALMALTMFTLGLTTGSLLSLDRDPSPAIRSSRLMLAGGVLIGGLMFALPWVTSSSLLILMGQWLLYCCLGLWLSAGLWWILSTIKIGPESKGPASHKRKL